MRRLRAFALFAVFAACSAVAGEPGVVKGTYVLNGKTYTPDHVYAITVPSLKEETKRDVRVVFSVGPQDESRLLSEGQGEKLSLTVTLGPGWAKTDPAVGFRYAHGSGPTSADLVELGVPPYSTSSFSGLPDATFESKAFGTAKGERTSGKLHIPLPSKRQEVELGADLEFDVPVLGHRPKV